MGEGGIHGSDGLVLCRGEHPLREFVLGAEPLEVGRALGCDVVVHDPAVAARQWLIQRRGGTVVVYDLTAPGRRRVPRHLPIGERLGVGAEHNLVRVLDLPTCVRDGADRTEPVALRWAASEELCLLVGSGAEARRVRITGAPITIGTAADNDLALYDRAVSAHHCRIDPYDGGLRLRDLGSRNGTWVDGLAVQQARITAGAHIRIGRTDLRMIARSERGGMVAVSAAMQGLLVTAGRYARLAWPVLILGESGAGKEGIARLLHAAGPRSGQPWVAINAGGLSESLLDAELFGYERGAFTGAAGQHRGVFEQASGGTLFLDEVGELSLASQARLLRVLESWEVRRLGAERSRAVDVRLICATHRCLQTLVREGRFREDLYFRLARLVLEVPPLRSRPADILPLAERFLVDVRAEVGDRRLTPDAEARLRAHSWPGNVRELRNVVCTAAANAASMHLDARDIEAGLRVGAGGLSTGCDGLADMLALHGGNVSAAARALGVPRSTLRDRLGGVPPRAAAVAPGPATHLARRATL